MNCDKIYHKIGHRTSKNVLANAIKDVTVKQATLTVTDIDKINTVSSQAVLEMSFVFLASGQL